jgi:hypothetical protein
MYVHSDSPGHSSVCRPVPIYHSLVFLCMTGLCQFDLQFAERKREAHTVLPRIIKGLNVDMLLPGLKLTSSPLPMLKPLATLDTIQWMYWNWSDIPKSHKNIVYSDPLSASHLKVGQLTISSVLTVVLGKIILPL